jgi:cation diffusion facilitator family transporter
LDIISVKKKAALISLSFGILMFVGKMAAYMITDSAAIFSDAIESIVHIFATAFMFVSIIISVKPATRLFPYGFGKIEYFSAGTEGFLIIFAAVAIILYAISDLIAGPQIKEVDTGIIIISLAAVLNVLLGIYLIRKGKLTNSLILVADGKHVLTDSYTSFGVVIGIAMVSFTGIQLLDPLFAIAVALNILLTGKNLVLESINGLLNKTETNIIEKIAVELNKAKLKYDDLIDIHLFRYWRSGDRYYVDMHCTIPKYLHIQRAHLYEEELLQIMKNVFSAESVELKVHWDPCTVAYCFYCSKKDCSYRTSAYSKEIIFDSSKIVDKAYYNY